MIGALEQHFSQPARPALAAEGANLRLSHEALAGSHIPFKAEITGPSLATSLHLPGLHLVDDHQAQAAAVAKPVPAHHPNFFEEVGNVAAELGKGAVDEIVHHPGHVLQVAAEGLAAGVVIGAVGTAVVAAGIVSAPVLAVGGAVVGVGLLAAQVAPHAGEIIHNTAVVADPTAHTAAEIAQSRLAVEHYGGVALDGTVGMVAGMAGGAIGSKLATMAIESATASAATASAAESAEAGTAPKAIEAGAERPIVNLDTPAANTSEPELRLAFRDAITQAKADGAPLTIKIDTRVPLTDASGAPIKMTQADVLYQELQAAHPENHFTFSKPDINPGDPKYVEFAAPDVQTDGLRISTKENPITLGSDTTLGDGSTLPSGSRFAVGTTHDGVMVRSAAPAGKVWAIKPDGSFVQVAEAGQSAPIPAEALSSDPLKAGQVVNSHTPEGFQNHIIVRADAKAVSPDNLPLLDAYPSGGEGFEAAYKPGTQPGFFAPKAKFADHFLLPSNLTVEAETAWGGSTAAGSQNAYFMSSGFADAQEATALNYSGATRDAQSAAELLRIRTLQGLEK